MIFNMAKSFLLLGCFLGVLALQVSCQTAVIADVTTHHTSQSSQGNNNSPTTFKLSTSTPEDVMLTTDESMTNVFVTTKTLNAVQTTDNADATTYTPTSISNDIETTTKIFTDVAETITDDVTKLHDITTIDDVNTLDDVTTMMAPKEMKEATTSDMDATTAESDPTTTTDGSEEGTTMSLSPFDRAQELPDGQQNAGSNKLDLTSKKPATKSKSTTSTKSAISTTTSTKQPTSTTLTPSTPSPTSSTLQSIKPTMMSSTTKTTSQATSSTLFSTSSTATESPSTISTIQSTVSTANKSNSTISQMSSTSNQPTSKSTMLTSTLSAKPSASSTVMTLHTMLPTSATTQTEAQTMLSSMSPTLNSFSLSSTATMLTDIQTSSTAATMTKPTIQSTIEPTTLTMGAVTSRSTTVKPTNATMLTVPNIKVSSQSTALKTTMLPTEKSTLSMTETTTSAQTSTTKTVPSSTSQTTTKKPVSRTTVLSTTPTTPRTSLRSSATKSTATLSTKFKPSSKTTRSSISSIASTTPLPIVFSDVDFETTAMSDYDDTTPIIVKVTDPTEVTTSPSAFSGPIIGLIVGVTVLAIVLIVVIASLLCRKKQKRHQGSTSKQNEEEVGRDFKELASIQHGSHPEKVDDSLPRPTPIGQSDNIDSSSLRPSPIGKTDSKQEQQQPPQAPQMPQSILKKPSKLKRSSRHIESNPSLHIMLQNIEISSDVNQLAINGIGAENNAGFDYNEIAEDGGYEQFQAIYYNTSPASRPIPITRFPQYMKEKKATPAILPEEYLGILQGLLAESWSGLHPSNLQKNKYSNVIAYDHSRVRLTTGPHQTDHTYYGGYINASYISGFNHVKNMYIATQGPTSRTVNDFWLMVWETCASRIVMLCDLREDGRPLCTQYWPTGGQVVFGDISVSMSNTWTYADHIIRLFTVTRGTSSRLIHQYHLISWPDQGVPRDPKTLINFREKVKGHEPAIGPIIVHCNSGIGATGVFISLDCLLGQAAIEGGMDIVACVRRMRWQRPNMVQNLEQYAFLYDCLLAALYSNSDDYLQLVTDSAIVPPDGRRSILVQDPDKRDGAYGSRTLPFDRSPAYIQTPVSTDGTYNQQVTKAQIYNHPSHTIALPTRRPSNFARQPSYEQPNMSQTLYLRPASQMSPLTPQQVQMTPQQVPMTPQQIQMTPQQVQMTPIPLMTPHMTPHPVQMTQIGQPATQTYMTPAQVNSTYMTPMQVNAQPTHTPQMSHVPMTPHQRQGYSTMDPRMLSQSNTTHQLNTPQTVTLNRVNMPHNVAPKPSQTMTLQRLSKNPNSSNAQTNNNVIPQTMTLQRPTGGQEFKFSSQRPSPFVQDVRRPSDPLPVIEMRQVPDVPIVNPRRTSQVHFDESTLSNDKKKDHVYSKIARPDIYARVVKPKQKQNPVLPQNTDIYNLHNINRDELKPDESINIDNPGYSNTDETAGGDIKQDKAKPTGTGLSNVAVLY